MDNPQPQAPGGRRHPLADVLAAVMLLLATLAYLSRLVWGLSQPGYEIQPRDFGSLLAAIIAIPAGVLLVTGMKPPVARLTGALGAGAMLLFNAVNLTGGSVDDVIGKYGSWAAIPIVVSTVIAIVALYRASWSPAEQIAGHAEQPAEQEFAPPDDHDQQFAPQHDDDDEYAQPSRHEDGFAPRRSAPAVEPSAGVIGAPESDDEGALAPALPHRSPFTAPPPSAEPAFPEPAQPEISQPDVPERVAAERVAADQPMAEMSPELPTRGERAMPERSSLALPEMSLPESGPRTGPVERFASDPLAPSGEPETGFAVTGPAGTPPAPQPTPGPYVPERLTPHLPEPEPAANAVRSETAPQARFTAPQQASFPPAQQTPVPQQASFAEAQPTPVPQQTPPTEPFAPHDPALFHAATDGIPAVQPADPPTAVLPRPDFTANPQQSWQPPVDPQRSGPPPVESQQSGPGIGAPPAGPDPHGVPTPPPFPPPGNEPIDPAQGIAPPVPTPETAPLHTGGPAAPQPPEPQHPQDISGQRSGRFPDGAPLQGNPRQGNGPVHQPFGPPRSMPYPPPDARHGSPRLPGTEPIPAQAAPRQPVLRQPGGFLAPPPLDPDPAWQQPGPGQPHPDNARPRLHDVSASDRPGPYEMPPPRAEDDPAPLYPDHRQAPPKRLAPPPWAQEQ